MTYDKTKQFNLEVAEFTKKLDLLNWNRYAFIFKELFEIKPKSVMEIGPGEGTLRKLYSGFAEKYETLDVNKKLSPTYLGDVRDKKQELIARYDCVIAADILEHIPFGDLASAFGNINAYLKPSGTALITIPHRLHYIFIMTSLFGHTPLLLRFPTLKRLLRKKVNIDLDHEWEVGDGEHGPRDVEKVMEQAGFKIEKCQKLAYVDFWTLRK